MKKLLSGFLSIILIIGLVGLCRAEEAASKVSVGGDMRIRGQVTKNNTDLNSKVYDNDQIYRHRVRLWIKGEVEEGYSGYVRLATEPRWGRQDTTYNDCSAKAEWTNHLIIDNAYLEAKNFLGTPLNLKIGRQDLTYGEGFLVFEGTPADGSRTIYFDAIKLSGVFGPNTVDLFTAKPDEKNYKSNDDEDVYGLYITNKSLADHTLDLYALQREQRDPALKNSTTAVGVRASGKLIENLTYAAEVAKEFGTYDKRGYDLDRDAIGGLASLTYAMPEVPTQPSIKLGAYYTSGDDSDTTDKNEAWDGFYSEFPKYGYGDLLINLTTLDQDEGTWTNHLIYEVDLKTNPLPKMTASLGYLYLAANEAPSGASKVRGRCPQAQVAYQFTPSVSGHALIQYFQSGNYYVDTNPTKVSTDNAIWGRVEMAIKF